MKEEFDFLVIGSGIAGLTFALDVAPYGSVCLVTKREKEESNTWYAQGGIAGVWSEEDSVEAHVQDTLEAGAGLCDERIVRLTVEEGPARIRELIQRGVEFSRSDDSKAEGGYDLGKEGGHSKRRVLHASDMTGREVARVLLEHAASLDAITILEEHIAIDLITTHRISKSRRGRKVGDQCLGAYVLHEATGKIRTLAAKATILATGGAGKVYLYTSNPDVATGDGVAMGLRAGAQVSNMEFFQFHPTCLYHPAAKSFLISEALRGEGAVLRRANGEAFMTEAHPMADLAPRDIVARAIDQEMKESGEDCVFLDITHHSREFLEERFPNIVNRCRDFGIEPSEMPIPVVPAAHYQCGGLLTDEYGATSLRGLYACGEVACTGLHGANRLASNSLLEALVFSRRASQSAIEFIKEPGPHVNISVPTWSTGMAVDADEAVLVTQCWHEVRQVMWNYVGIVRSDKRLARARRRLELVEAEVREDYWSYTLTRDLIELRNIVTVGLAIIGCATMRRESRGLHFSLDCLERDQTNWNRPTLLGN